MRDPSDEDCGKGTWDWSQALSHRLASAGVYFVTARTAGQMHHHAPQTAQYNHEGTAPAGRPISCTQSSILQLPDPHIAEADGVAVILKGDGELVRVSLVFGRGVLAHPTRAAAEDGVVLN